MAQEADQLLSLIRDELQELSELGCDTWELERRASLIEEEGGPDLEQKLRKLYAGLERLDPAPDFPYEEPDGLEEIRTRRPEGPRRIAVPLSDHQLDDKTLGAWLGRAAGCMLGKPVEGWAPEKIGDLMDVCGLNELTDYLPEPPSDAGFGIRESAPHLLRGNIRRAERDDDTDYTVLGLRILQRHGRGFTPRQVADSWLSRLPFHRTYTAERVAYRNLVNGIEPPESARHRNPYREWIGAQIRADAYGYACPGRPEEAAGMAWRDASISHVKNGIYGEMWAAAMISAAFVTANPGKAIRVGLSEIPANCRLAEAVEDVLAWHEEGCTADEARGRIDDQYGNYHRVHTINNAAIVALALLWGEGDFSRTIGLAVRSGLDTDCNGATAGSVAGAMLGAAAIPEHWTAPLNDRLGTAVSGEPELNLSGLAEETRKVQQNQQ